MKEEKIRKIEPYTVKWEKLADNLARSLHYIRPCKHCGYPVLDGYCCGTCKSTTP